ncbi:MAG TPA: IclR family transcriptional regulator [Candidatus Angelobacter sp.]|jgi:IclR family KDG regulon transcriptional repressor|nr:IclR family transcriptional regulator [Candidatus Angelobacter sp.]
MVRTRESRPAQVGVVMKVLKILEVIHSNPSGLQLKEIAKQTAVNKSTAYRFLAHLQGEGYLYRDDAGAYVIGPKLARMGSGTNFEESLRKMGRPVLQKLWTATSETVNLAILDGQQILYLDVIESSHTFRFASQNGARRPLYCTALGKAILAHLPEEDTKELLASCTFERQTPRTLTQPTKLKKDLVKTRMQGYALDNEEAVLGARCIAAPVFDATGKVIGGVSVSGPLTRMTEEKVPVIAAMVKEAANSISRRLGYQRA